MISKNLSITVSNWLILHNCSFKADIIKLSSYPNPAYLGAVKYGSNPYALQRIPEFLHMAREPNDNDIAVPRGFDFTRLSEYQQAQIRNAPKKYHTKFVKVTWPDPLHSLTKIQEKVKTKYVESLVSGVSNYGARCFVIPTSTGKSISAMSLASHLGAKALVLYNTNLIKRSWLQDIEFYLDIPRKDIGIIQGAKSTIGSVITLASVQTLGRRKPLWDSIFSEFGVMIVDECDLMGKNILTDVVSACDIKHIIGMTATINKENAYWFFLHNFLGKPFVRIASSTKDTDTSMALKSAEVIESNFEYSGDTDSYLSEFNKGERLQRAFDYNNLLECLCYHEDTNMKIVRAAVKEWTSGNSVLITSKRIAHVEILADMLEEAGVDDVVTYTGSDNSSKKYADMLVDKIKSRKIRCVVAVESMVLRGANINAVNRLIIATPMKQIRNIRQLIGRLRRKFANKVDNKVYVINYKRVKFLRNMFYSKTVTALNKEGITQIKKPIC